MNVLVYDNEEQIGIAAGNYMCGQVLAKPNSVLGLATGSTPLKPYGHMIKLFENGAVDFSKVTTFNLDEYCKLDVNDKKLFDIGDQTRMNMFDKVTGSKEIRRRFTKNYKVSDIIDYWNKDVESFRKASEPYRLYK